MKRQQNAKKCKKKYKKEKYEQIQNNNALHMDCITGTNTNLPMGYFNIHSNYINPN